MKDFFRTQDALLQTSKNDTVFPPFLTVEKQGPYSVPFLSEAERPKTEVQLQICVACVN